MYIQERLDELYKEFKDITRPNLVRNGHKGDAFSLLAFETVLSEYHGIRRVERAQHLDLLEKSIVPPPDDGIDIFFQEDGLDDPKFHIIQCKSSSLPPSEITGCFLKMRHALDSYLGNPREVSKNLRRIVSASDFEREFLDSCTFYVVHSGEVDAVRNQKENEKIITIGGLADLIEGTESESVPFEQFPLDTKNNFIVNNFVSRPDAEVNPNVPRSILCNLSGYNLAKLDQKYSQSAAGRNILYGGNLREALSKKSKTYSGMQETIKDEPDLFLFYNNGITILAEHFDANTDGQLELRKFSIINGAQTTSTLGAFLHDAEANKDEQAISCLKKVLVLTKIYEVNPKLPNHSDVSERIKIFNNTQTPLSSRDMVSIRDEQHKLQRKFLEGSPQLFINIKKGERVPPGSKLSKHAEVSNEALAQIALCGLHFDPSTALKKKVQLFENEGKDGVLLNDLYNRLFNPNDGTLFRLSSLQLNELLFVKRLHEDTRISYKKKMVDQISSISQTKLGPTFTEELRTNQITAIKRNLDIAQKCFFFNIAAYYKLRQRFDFAVKGVDSMSFDSEAYYSVSNKTYKEQLHEAFYDLVFSRTIRIIRENALGESVYTWVRREDSQSTFFERLSDSYNDEYDLAGKYEEFVRQFKSK